MHLDHHRICTWNSEVEHGKVYLYTEGNLACKVKVGEINPQPEGVRLSLKVIAKPPVSPIIMGEEFEVLAAWNHSDNNRWWYLHDPDLVVF